MNKTSELHLSPNNLEQEFLKLWKTGTFEGGCKLWENTFSLSLNKQLLLRLCKCTFLGQLLQLCISVQSPCYQVGNLYKSRTGID